MFWVLLDCCFKSLSEVPASPMQNPLITPHSPILYRSEQKLCPPCADCLQSLVRLILPTSLLVFRFKVSPFPFIPSHPPFWVECLSASIWDVHLQRPEDGIRCPPLHPEYQKVLAIAQSPASTSGVLVSCTSISKVSWLLYIVLGARPRVWCTPADILLWEPHPELLALFILFVCCF